MARGQVGLTVGENQPAVVDIGGVLVVGAFVGPLDHGQCAERGDVRGVYRVEHVDVHDVVDAGGPPADSEDRAGSGFKNTS